MCNTGKGQNHSDFSGSHLGVASKACCDLANQEPELPAQDLAPSLCHSDLVTAPLAGHTSLCASPCHAAGWNVAGTHLHSLTPGHLVTRRPRAAAPPSSLCPALASCPVSSAPTLAFNGEGSGLYSDCPSSSKPQITTLTPGPVSKRSTASELVCGTGDLPPGLP